MNTRLRALATGFLGVSFGPSAKVHFGFTRGTTRTGAHLLKWVNFLKGSLTDKSGAAE